MKEGTGQCFNATCTGLMSNTYRDSLMLLCTVTRPLTPVETKTIGFYQVQYSFAKEEEDEENEDEGMGE